MDTHAVERWLDTYFAVWESTDAARIGALFAADATCWVGPFAEPVRGRDEIARRWAAGTSTLLHHAFDVLAVDGDLAVAHWTVRLRLGPDDVVDLDGILVLDFDAAGACRSHREWFVSRPAGA